MSGYELHEDAYTDIDPLDRDHPVGDTTEVLYGEPYDFERQDINYYALGKITTMVARARMALDDATSHRGFKVANVALYEDREGGPWQYMDQDGDLVRGEGPRIATIVTTNSKIKLREEQRGPHDVADVAKNCAETNSLIIADNAGYGRLHTGVVAATTNQTRIHGVNGECTPTLCLCKECIGHFRKNPLVDNDSMIITVGSAEDIMEIRSNKQLQKAHKLKENGQDARVPHKQIYRPSDWPERQKAYKAKCKAEQLGYRKRDRQQAARYFQDFLKKAITPIN